MSNRDGAPRQLAPGYYALGNLLLDSPDVQPLKQRIADTPPAVEPYFAVLAQAKVLNGQYGTRCSTVLLDSGDELRYAERSFAPDGSEGETVQYAFSIRASATSK
jgi:uncharacterized protein with NRDE domain